MASEKWNALVIDVDNSLRLEQLKRSDWYDGIHRLLNGAFCEVVHCWGLPYPQVMLVDDCGAINGGVYNPMASMLYRGPIYGPALIVEEGIVDGEPDIVGADGLRLTKLIGLLREVLSYAER